MQITKKYICEFVKEIQLTYEQEEEINNWIENNYEVADLNLEDQVNMAYKTLYGEIRTYSDEESFTYDIDGQEAVFELVGYLINE